MPEMNLPTTDISLSALRARLLKLRRDGRSRLFLLTMSPEMAERLAASGCDASKLGAISQVVGGSLLAPNVCIVADRDDPASEENRFYRVH